MTDVLASRVFNGSILELCWNGETGDGFSACVRMIDEYGEKVATATSVEQARNFYVHTSLYEDEFVRNEWTADEINAAFRDEYIGGTSIFRAAAA